MPALTVSTIDLSVRPMPKEIAVRYAEVRRVRPGRMDASGPHGKPHALGAGQDDLS